MKAEDLTIIKEYTLYEMGLKYRKHRPITPAKNKYKQHARSDMETTEEEESTLPPPRLSKMENLLVKMVFSEGTLV